MATIGINALEINVSRARVTSSPVDLWTGARAKALRCFVRGPSSFAQKSLDAC